jgi:hypothetical protein
MVAAKGACLMLSRFSQAAQTPEFAKVFCFFSSEKKAFLLAFSFPNKQPSIRGS